MFKFCLDQFNFVVITELKPIQQSHFASLLINESKPLVHTKFSPLELPQMLTKPLKAEFWDLDVFSGGPPMLLVLFARLASHDFN